MLSGRSAEAALFTEAALRRATVAGDFQGVAWLQTWNGDARLGSGDPSGLDAMRRGAAALADAGNSKSSSAYGNLAENLVALGKITDASAVATTAVGIARRFGVNYRVAVSNAISAKVLYEAGDWDGALEAAGAAIPTIPAVEAQARWARGRILLARAQVEDADAEARDVIRHGESGEDDDALLTGLALAASVAVARGDATAVRTISSRFHGRWGQIGGMLTLAPALAHLATAAPSDPALIAATSLMPEMSRWRNPIGMLAQGDYRLAAEAFAAFGAAPAAALAWLLEADSAAADGRHSDAADARERALSFFRQVGATLYISRMPEVRSA
jgi:hypothetical protein